MHNAHAHFTWWTSISLLILLKKVCPLPPRSHALLYEVSCMSVVRRRLFGGLQYLSRKYNFLAGHKSDWLYQSHKISMKCWDMFDNITEGGRAHDPQPAEPSWQAAWYTQHSDTDDWSRTLKLPTRNKIELQTEVREYFSIQSQRKPLICTMLNSFKNQSRRRPLLGPC